MTRLLTVVLPDEYAEMISVIDEISKEKRQSVSRTIRDMLSDYMQIEPVSTREIKKRNMYKNKL
jgi:hypothetical protein